MLISIFLHFEKVAGNLKWPKKYWIMLQSVLVGKAREIYTQLDVEQAANYDNVKELILKGYELVPEDYRQKFRIFEKLGCQTYVEFARSKKLLFDRWCHSQKVDKDHDKLRQFIFIEEFKSCIHSDVRTFIDEQKAETLEDAARLADELSLSHKVTFVEKPKRPYPPPGQDPPPTLPRWFANQRSHQNEDHGGNRILVTTLQIVVTSPGQDKIGLCQVSILSHLHVFFVEEKDI